MKMRKKIAVSYGSSGATRMYDDGTEVRQRWWHELYDAAVRWWVSRHWRRIQRVFAGTGTRYYGDGGTIHRTEHIDVETDHNGDVVAVWFRCQPLPFKQAKHDRDSRRSAEMRAMYERHKVAELHGVQVRDRE